MGSLLMTSKIYAADILLFEFRYQVPGMGELISNTSPLNILQE